MPSDRPLYGLLEIQPDATQDEIRKAYVALALRYHPDRGSGAEGEERFKQIQGAYTLLSDPDAREVYDRYGDSGLRNMETVPVMTEVSNTISAVSFFRVTFAVTAFVSICMLIFFALLGSKLDDNLSYSWYVVPVPCYIIFAMFTIATFVSIGLRLRRYYTQHKASLQRRRQRESNPSEGPSATASASQTVGEGPTTPITVVGTSSGGGVGNTRPSSFEHRGAELSDAAADNFTSGSALNAFAAVPTSSDQQEARAKTDKDAFDQLGIPKTSKKAKKVRELRFWSGHLVAISIIFTVLLLVSSIAEVERGHTTRLRMWFIFSPSLIGNILAIFAIFMFKDSLHLYGIHGVSTPEVIILNLAAAALAILRVLTILLIILRTEYNIEALEPIFIAIPALVYCVVQGFLGCILTVLRVRGVERIARELPYMSAEQQAFVRKSQAKSPSMWAEILFRAFTNAMCFVGILLSVLARSRVESMSYTVSFIPFFILFGVLLIASLFLFVCFSIFIDIEKREEKERELQRRHEREEAEADGVSRPLDAEEARDVTSTQLPLPHHPTATAAANVRHVTTTQMYDQRHINQEESAAQQQQGSSRVRHQGLQGTEERNQQASSAFPNVLGALPSMTPQRGKAQTHRSSPAERQLGHPHSYTSPLADPHQPLTPSTPAPARIGGGAAPPTSTSLVPAAATNMKFDPTRTSAANEARVLMGDARPENIHHTAGPPTVRGVFQFEYSDEEERITEIET